MNRMSSYVLILPTVLVILIAIIFNFRLNHLYSDHQDIIIAKPPPGKVLRREREGPSPTTPIPIKLREHHSDLISFLESQDHQISWHIPVIHLPADNEQIGKILNQIIARGEPTLIRNTIVDQWKARKDWLNIKYLERQFAKGKQVKRTIVSPSHRLVYADTSRGWRGDRLAISPSEGDALEVALAKVPGFASVNLPKHQVQDFSSGGFMGRILDHQDNQYVYLVANEGKKNLQDWMIRDIQPIDQFRARNGWTGSPLNLQIWFGEGGLISLLHYDASNNFFVHLQGNKSLVVLPPKEAPKVQLFPWSHPGDAHTQLNLDSGVPLTEGINSEMYDDLFTINATVVHMVPGDVLYIPAYWLHHVVTWNTSMAASVSLISKSEEQGIMAEIERVPVPVQSSWTRGKQRRAAALMVSMVRKKIRLPNSAETFHDLLKSRFRVWLKTRRAEEEKDLVTKCGLLKSEVELQGLVEGMAAKAAGLFQSLKDIGIRQLLFWNYVEAVAVVVANGNPSIIPDWIQQVAEKCH